jgi:hypothetical protein
MVAAVAFARLPIAGIDWHPIGCVIEDLYAETPEAIWRTSPFLEDAEASWQLATLMHGLAPSIALEGFDVVINRVAASASNHYGARHDHFTIVLVDVPSDCTIEDLAAWHIAGGRTEQFPGRPAVSAGQ